MLIGTPPNLVLAASWTSQLDAVSVLLILLIYNSSIANMVRYLLLFLAKLETTKEDKHKYPWARYSY
eukprot:SAG31_NODE_995_length_10494_cov_8.173641_1_plen_67_part_00